MRSLALVVASAALLAGTSASAQSVFNIQSSAGSSYFTPDAEGGFIETPVAGEKGRFPDNPAATGGAIYNSFVNVGDTAIFFESSNVTSQGPFSSFTSYSELSFEIETGSEFNFHSQITPQGLGMYLADTSNGCLFTNSCVQVSDADYQFSDLTSADGNPFFGGVAFEFEILDNSSQLYYLQGSVFMGDGIGPCDGGFCILNGMGAAAVALASGGFAQQTLPNDFSAIAFGWGAVDLGFGMGAGTHTITYKTRVSTFTNANCLDDTVCLVAYSGFGDPIGRGGGIDAASAGLRGQLGSFDHGGLGGLIQGLTFTPQVFNIPTFQDGDLVYTQSNGAVPEPGAWALMILGFGTMGAALRRRRAALAAS